MCSLPSDSVLLPIPSGALLVSRSHATFCAIPHEHLSVTRDALAGVTKAGQLAPGLCAELERHGFFGAPRPPPQTRPKVQLQLTNACNLRCSYCCTDSGSARPRELSLADWRGVVDEARQAFGPEVAFGLLGGEPLLVPFALDLADYIVAGGSSLTIFTNGTGLGDARIARRAAALVNRGVIIRVSLAGATRGACDSLSGAERFDLALAGLRELARQGATARVDLMLFPADVDEITTYLPALRAQLPPRTRLGLGLAFAGGREAGSHIFPSRAALESALDRIALESGEAVAAPSRAPVTARREACVCALGTTLNVRSDGLLYACFRMHEPVGDLRRQRLAEVAATLRANPRPARGFLPCAECPLATLCGGGCRSDNLLLSGDPERPLCGPWRLQVLSELLAEDRVSCLDWPTCHLASEARRRGIEAPLLGDGS
jgi:mycofactocin biosynthetic radical S-adenosylmethionine protein MftC